MESPQSISALSGKAASEPHPPAQASQPKRVLIVDDEPGITDLLKLSLEMTGQYVVRTENRTNNILAIAEEFLPDLVFLDVLMPGKDGGEVATLLQGSAKLKSVRIVFLTATATKTEVQERGGLIGGFPFLAKPVTRDEILLCLAAHLPR
jgi:DNA-binding response OmpR family regulator